MVRRDVFKGTVDEQFIRKRECRPLNVKQIKVHLRKFQDRETAENLFSSKEQGMCPVETDKYFRANICFYVNLIPNVGFYCPCEGIV